MTLPPPTAPPAGWYPAEWAAGGHAYWDGRQWMVPGYQQPVREPHPTLPWQAALGAMIAIIVPLVGARGVALVLADRAWPVWLLVVLSASIGYGPALAWCWYVSRRWGSGRFRTDMGLGARWSDLGWGPVVYLCCLVAQFVLAIVITVLQVPFESNIEEGGDIDRSYVIAILVLAVVAAPIAEEIIFRGAVMRGLRSVMPAVATVAVQAVLFGLVHIDPVRGAGNIGLVVMLSGVGAVLGGAAYLFRRIIPSMIAHAILNSVALTLALTGALDRLSS